MAVETAEAGWPVVLVERGPSLGGRVAANHLYFPKMCPPPCGLEINYQRLRKNPGIRIYTQAEVTKPAEGPGGGTSAKGAAWIVGLGMAAMGVYLARRRRRGGQA